MAKLIDDAGADLECDFVGGEVQPLDESVETWQTPGLDGVGAQNLGANASRWSFVVRKYGTLAAVEAWSLAVRALKGTVISAVDDWGTEHGDGSAGGGILVVSELSRLSRTTAVIPGSTTVARGVHRIGGVVTE